MASKNRGAAIYQQKSQFKIWLIIIAVLGLITLLLYTSNLATRLQDEERKKISLVAESYEQLQKLTLDSLIEDQFDFLQGLGQNNNTIPVILLNESGKIVGTKNLDSTRNYRNPQDSVYFYAELAKMQNSYDPVLFTYQYPNPDGTQITKQQYIYYNDSALLVELKRYPYLQIGILLAFALIAYVAFNTARRAEQNRVWLGMAKETAHQLGTPLSSMMGWLALLKLVDDPNGQADMVANELNKDVERLQVIADRFSKIGSEPHLSTNDIVSCVQNTVNYVQRRAPNKVQIKSVANPALIYTLLNPVLLEWVVENLLKNALDAMDDTGTIDVSISLDEKTNQRIIIDITDTGKGIERSKLGTVFEPGYSTKTRGWGLGLSLSKRIIEEYHKGRIFVLKSVINKGTTFRIILPKITQ